jgi:hypothetical protein
MCGNKFLCACSRSAGFVYWPCFAHAPRSLAHTHSRTLCSVFYALFSDAGHFDILRPLPINMSDPSLFAGAPWSIRSMFCRVNTARCFIHVPRADAAETRNESPVYLLKRRASSFTAHLLR